MLADSSFVTRRRVKKLLRRKRQVDHRGCWLWTGSISVYGYGVCQVRKQQVRVHRMAAWLYLDLDPDDLTLDVHHTCGVKHCFNPKHLEVLTRREHARVHISA